MANLHEQHFSQPISKNLNFEVDHSPQRSHKVKYIDFQLQDQHSFSTESTSLSHKELTAMGKTSSQDQCASSDSDSVHEESYGKHGQDMNKSALFLCNPEMSGNASQAEISQPIFPYAYSDPYFSGLFAAYGPHHNIMQPQVMAAAAGRVPLPVDISEDGPIYVNAKQYHGILRRRQTRAKMEAQNKLVKTRKPYLHESRHQHALNRVRGTGGRFLSTKKLQSGSATAIGSSHRNGADPFRFSYHGDRVEGNKYDGPSGGEGTRVSGSDGTLHMQGSGGLVYNGNRHYASVVR